MNPRMGLRSFRLWSGIKLVQLARASEISISDLSLIENEWKDLSEETARRLVAGYKSFGLDAKEVVRVALLNS